MLVGFTSASAAAARLVVGVVEDEASSLGSSVLEADGGDAASLVRVAKLVEGNGSKGPV